MEINNAIQQIKNLKSLNNKEIDYKLMYLDEMFKNLTNTVDKSIVRKRRASGVEYEYVERSEYLYKLANPFREVNYFNASTLSNIEG